MNHLFLLSFFPSLFTVEGAEVGSVLSMLPYIITAIALGVILAGGVYTFWQGISSTLFKNLLDANALDKEAGKSLLDLGYGEKKKTLKLLLRLLSKPTCVLYKFLSCDPRDKQIESLMAEGDASQKPSKKVAPRRLEIDENTPFYILADKAEYAKKKGGKFQLDDVMSFVYVALLCVGIWFAVLSFLDPIVSFMWGV